MAGKRKSTKKRNSNEIPAYAKPGEDETLVISRSFLRPTVQAAVTLNAYGKAFGDIDLAGLVQSLTELTDASISGDLKRAEAMLTTQAHTLDAIFNNLARRAINAEYMDNFEKYLKLALRAQSQSRATWETLATIKNPPVMGYVRQANIAHGPQQVNNASAAPSDAPRTGENSNLQNKLLEEKDGERLDTGATGATGRAHPDMATVGEVDRADNRGR